MILVFDRGRDHRAEGGLSESRTDSGEHESDHDQRDRFVEPGLQPGRRASGRSHSRNGRGLGEQADGIGRVVGIFRCDQEVTADARSDSCSACQGTSGTGQYLATICARSADLADTQRGCDEGIPPGGSRGASEAPQEVVRREFGLFGRNSATSFRNGSLIPMTWGGPVNFWDLERGYALVLRVSECRSLSAVRSKPALVSGRVSTNIEPSNQPPSWGDGPLS